ncbi:MULTISPECIES: transglycosylase domain-containing protein [unclassified Sphingomonas]|uniref:transglycosylase domain-containing protein n=1 Tax=unclassified Sphingomonas TaxID=196159 RepID=UPI0009E6C0B6|nr:MULTISPECIES: PBP1A family penicillin-binding protein [unclassified Sphingomonas]
MAARSASKPRRWRRILGWTVVAGAIVGLFALIALTVAVFSARASLPSFAALKSSQNGQMIQVRAVDGTIIASLGPSYGEWIGYDRIPPVMRDAMIAVEDRRFRAHPGVDPIALARIAKFAIDNRGTGRRLQGASTITQQVARTIFLSNKYDVSRKLREMVLALAIERKFTKDQILELYLNKVYFGGGAYGIDAASRRFFGHPATQLSLSEAAVIAGLVKAPSRYSPTADAEAAIDRASVVLDLMVETGAITADEAAAAAPQSVKLAPEPKQNSVRYFTDWALPQLDLLIDETQAPLEVWTTLDLSMQRDADAAIRAFAPAGSQGALVALDRDGAVRAMVGGKDYVSSIYNRATQATRQPGSAFKLFVYLAALENGFKPTDMVVDAPITINGWSPRNSSGRFNGEMTLRTAFAYSINTVAARLGQEIGFVTIADMARRFGITTPVDTQPAMVLGTSDVRLIDMTRAFASVAQKGVAVTPFGITRVTANGETIYAHQVDTSRVLVAPFVAAQMTDLLQTAVATGTGRAAQIGRPVAGKTGTTTLNKDGWFIGFSSGITTGVWMGRDDSRPVGGLQGGTAPARAFASFMGKAVRNRPVEAFDTEVTLPEWQLEPDAESYLGEPDNGAMLVDPDGNPLEPGEGVEGAPYPGGEFGDPADEGETAPAPERFDQGWIDRAIGREPREPRREPTREPTGRETSRRPAEQRPPVVVPAPRAYNGPPPPVVKITPREQSSRNQYRQVERPIQ